MSLSQSLNSIISYYQSEPETKGKTTRPLGHAVLILTNSDLADIDSKKAYDALASIKTSNPDLRFIYVTPKESFETFAANEFNNDQVVQISGEADVEAIMDGIGQAVKNIPAQIINNYNQNSTYELYLTPNVSTFLEIHHKYTAAVRVNLKVQY